MVEGTTTKTPNLFVDNTPPILAPAPSYAPLREVSIPLEEYVELRETALKFDMLRKCMMSYNCLTDVEQMIFGVDDDDAEE